MKANQFKKNATVQSVIVSMFLSLTLPLLGAAAAEKPNIVYILADDLGYGDVQCLNPDRGKIPTPHIDRFASQGMTFTDAHSGSSVCTPTRYGVLTGRYCWRTRLKSGVIRYGAPLIEAGRKTVAGLLRDQGYHTMGVGKWHLGSRYQRPGEAITPAHLGPNMGLKSPLPPGTRIFEGPTTRGFDNYYWFKLFPRHWSMIEDDEVVEDVPLNQVLPLLLERGKQYIAERAKSDKPFFMYWAPPVPHIPLAASDEWKNKSKLGAYGDYVMQFDAAVGELMASLDEHGLADDTLVIVTSDNGTAAYPPINAKALEAKGHYPSAQYRGYKMYIWEGGHRIPYFARWPKKIEGGVVTDQLTCLNDLMATLADLTGVEEGPDWGEDSVSMLPMLLEQKKVDRGPVVHHSLTGQFALRQGKWKMCFGPKGGRSWPEVREAEKEGLPMVQLYDLEADPGEQNNLHAEYPERLKKMTKTLNAIKKGGLRPKPGSKE